MISRTPMKRTQFGSRDLLANGGSCPVEVFCRLRPPKDECNAQQNDPTSCCIKVASATELILNSSEYVKNGQIRESRYEFSHILTDDVSQSAAFKELAVPLLDDLIQGKSSVLFTYGITGSGKTYTMMGPLNNPGLIPRSFDVLFNSIGPHLAKKYLLRSDRQNGYDIASEADILLERQRKEIQMNRLNPNQRAKAPEPSNVRTLDMTSLWNPQLNEDRSYVVFVTFVEIYNNYIYDLFDDEILNKGPQSKQIREDHRGRPYIREVKEIEVRSSDEAIELLNMGLKRRRIAHTQLNTESSRSHSVLSMRLVQFGNDIASGSLTKDDLIVSTIHLVDLAGSERVNRAKTVGERVKEASNINASLMVLRQCFETLRENQSQGANKMVPYRESKLTSFFKSYFDGEGRIRMILCVNPTVDGYEEIQHALKFGELTKDVMLPRALPPAPPVPPKTLRGQALLREMESQPHVQPTFFTEFNGQALISPFPPLEHSLLDGADDDQSIANLQEHLRRRIDERHRLHLLIHEQNDSLRKFTLELATDYDLTTSDRDDLTKENEQQSKTIRHLQTRIKLLEKSQNEIYKTTNQMERENKALKGQLEERSNEIRSLKADRRKEKNDFDAKIKIKINELEQQYMNELKTKEIQMRELERQHDDKLNIIRSMAVPIAGASASNENNTYPNQSRNRVEMLINQHSGRSTTSSGSRRRRQTPYADAMMKNNDENDNPMETAESQRQYRRSRSVSEIQCSNEVLQSVLSSKASNHQLGASDDRVYLVSEVNKEFVQIEVGQFVCSSPAPTVEMKKRCQSEERILQQPSAQTPSSRQGPAVPPKRFRM